MKPVVVVAIAPESLGIHVYGGFSNMDEAADFVAADLFPEQYTKIAIVPVELVQLDWKYEAW